MKKFGYKKSTAAVVLALALSMTLLCACGSGYEDDYGYAQVGGNGMEDNGFYDDPNGDYYEDDNFNPYGDDFGDWEDGEGSWNDDQWEDGDWSDEDWNNGWGSEDGYYDESDSYYDEDNNSNGGSQGSYYTGNIPFGKLGSASEMAGNTVVVSIFADDQRTRWTSSDDSLKQDARAYLKIGCDWITKNVAAYGTKANFIYDWSKNSDLYYETKINTNLAGDDMDLPVWEYIDQNIDSAALMSKYSADNVIYLVIVNTPLSNSATSCTRNYYEGMEYPYEMCFMYMGCDNEVEAPAAFAHEMLHTFGAPDLYMADEQGDNYGTTQSMVDYYEQSQSNDIMFTTYDAKSGTPYYDHISNEFTELDAYYVGLTDSSQTASKWGLESSQH